MISFWRQLRFLLWKGVVVKKRQKVWLAIEIVVPILLFAMLALIRTQDFTENHATCHYASKGFPSAGLAPFLNGWLCFFTNRCNQSPITGDEQRLLGEGVDKSLLIDGLRAISDQLAIIGEDPEAFNTTMQSLADVIHFLADVNLTQQADLPRIQPRDISLMPAELLAHGIGDLSEKFGDGPLANFIKELLAFKDVDSLVAALTCGQTITPETTGASPTGTQQPVHTVSDTLREFILDYVSQFSPGVADDSNATECYGIPFKETTCTYDNQPILQQVLPMLQGYILVAPTGPLADRLIEKLNDPLQYFDFFATTFPRFAEIALALQDAINDSDLPKAAENALTLLRRSGLVTEQTLNSLEQAIHTLFAPSSDASSLGATLKGVAENVDQALKCLLIDRIVPVANETVMESAAMCLQRRQHYCEVPGVITYKIRHLESMVDGTGAVADSDGNMRSRDQPFIDLKYTTFGFSYLQEAVDQALRLMMAEDGKEDAFNDVGAYSQQEPYPCYAIDTFSGFDITAFLALFVVLSWMVPSALLVKNIVYEKEQRLKELMRIMGLGDSVHFLSWALISLILNLISVIIISVLLKFAGILPAVSFSLLLVFLLLFAMASIAQSLLLSTLFTNANIATACTAVLFLLFFIPYELSSRMNAVVAVICLLFPQTAMGFGMTMIANGDSNGEALWSTMDQMTLDDFSLSFWEILVALAVDTVLFCILSWYISAVHPGIHGVSLPFYFFCLPSYWCGGRGEEGENNEGFDGDDDISLSDRMQPDPADAKMTVAIRRLEKVYGNGMKALDGLSLRLFEGQITALLGHNGAGKTTTMSMLCGLFSPSGGTASVYGSDLRKDMRSVRDTLGFCPQHNVLFDVLTVREQLYFYGGLKGVADKNLKAEVNKIIDSVDLREKKNEYSGSLSGGQKRRLSIGIALMGGSRFVILDEPTAGVDVNSRKGIWKVLMEHKQDRTILLSTHHMDEADMLSDRIAILSEGKLTALGSSVFLKNRFGEHTTLTCIKKDSRLDYSHTIVDICNLHDKVPVTLSDQSEEELAFHMPITADSRAMEEFFLLFDQRLKGWNLSEYGISAPTLQDIFVSLAPQSDLKLTKVQGGCMDKMLSCFKGSKNAIADSEQLTEPIKAESEDVCDTAPATRPSKARHARALLTARVHYTRRSWLILLFEMLVPILLLLLCELYAVYANKNQPSDISTQSPRYLTNDQYGDNTNHYLSLWDDVPAGAGAQLAETLLDYPGMGTRCVPDGADDPTYHPCWDDVFDIGELSVDSLLMDSQNDTVYNVNQTCGAMPYYWDCTVDDYPWDELPYFHANTSDYLVDLSYRHDEIAFRNLSQFRLINFFANHTYYFTGGLALGHVNPSAPSDESIQQRKEGWRTLREVLGVQTEVVGIDLSSLPTPNTTIPHFASAITMDSFVDRVVGAMDTRESVKLWYNNKRWFSLPIYTNVLSNSLLRMAHLRRGESLDTFDRGIIVINHPMNVSLDQSFDDGTENQNVTIFRIVLLLLVMSVIPAGYAVFLVEDRVSHSFHLQLVSGLSRWMYWAMAYLFDMSLYLMSIILIMCIYLALGVNDFTYTFSLAGSYILLWLVYGLVDVVLVYILQRCFTIAALAFVMIALGTFFVGTLTTMTVLILEQMVNSNTNFYVAYQVCYYTFLIFPQYNLGMGILRGSMAYQSVSFGEAYFRQINRPDLAGTVPMPDALQGEMMGIHILALIVQLLLGLALLAFLEYGSLGFMRRMETKKTQQLLDKEEQMINDDIDVGAEARRVEKIQENSSDYGLVVNGLAKKFSSNLTVRGVSFAVERGECFGLLGLNGAGKTTMFGMMTGRLGIGHGEVRILGERVSTRSSTTFRNLGYCPQFDALNMKLTTRENVELFARIRGIEERDMKGTVQSLLRSLHLLPYADVLTSALSGGNRRKLSVAVALVSQPPVIMLDEPSAGMDPGSQQFLWSVIGKMRRAGRAVILTSHSMEECEALCTRIAILDRGRIRCIGSKQHLKNKFGDGFSLTIKFTSTQQAEESQALISERFSKAKLIAVHCSAAFYRIPSDLTTVVQILRVVNEVKERFSVEDFSLSQTTLDEIFQYLSETSSAAKVKDEAVWTTNTKL